MSNASSAAKKLAHLLREFTAQAKQFLKFAYPHTVPAIFNVLHKPPNRLEGYGYINRLPHTQAYMQLHEDVTVALNAAILCLQSQLTAVQYEQPSSGCLRIKVKRFAGFTSSRTHKQI